MLRDEIFSIGPSGSRGWQLRVVPILLGTALWMTTLWPGVSPAREPTANPQSQAAAALKSGEAFLEEGELEKALAAFSQSVRLDPQDARAYYSRACICKRKGEPDKAAADLAQAVRLDPSAGWAYFDRGWAYGRTRHVDKAIADMTELIRLCPADSWSRAKRGSMFLLKGDYDKAIADLTEAIRLRPENPGARAHFLVSRALTYEEKGDHDKAIADDTEVIRLISSARPPYLGAYGSRAEPYRNRAWAYVQKGELDKAVADAAEAVRLDPKDAEALFVRGYAYGKKGAADKAASDLAAAARLDARRGEPELAYLIPFLDEVKSFLLFCNLPVYGLLGDWGLREDLGLSPAQERRLREVGAKFQAEHAKIEEGLGKLPQKEQDAKRDEVYSWENLQKTREPLRKEIEGILTPQQLDAFKKRAISQEVLSMLADPASLARWVGADREQAKKLRRLSDEVDRRLEAEADEQNQELLAVLDARQQQMLRAEIERQLCGVGAVGFGESLNSGTVVGTGTLAGSGVVTISGGTLLAGGAGGEAKTSTGTATVAAGSAADAGEAAEGGNMCLNVYMPLLDKAVRNRLGMSKAQQKKLLEIATKCQADQECAGAVVRSAEKTTVLDMCYSECDARTRAAAKQIEALLTPAQLAALKELNFREQVSKVLNDPFEQERMGLSQREKTAVSGALRAARKRSAGTMLEATGKALAILTPQQRERMHLESYLDSTPPAPSEWRLR